MTPQQATTQGKLYVVATPIGNLNDMTFRAVETLKQVDLILAEDTRHAQILLSAYQIQKPLQAFHAHNEAKLAQGLLERLKTGSNLAIVSDAGTPLIQDPGFPLVKLATEAGVQVIPIPGACALITALSAAGLPTDQFLFAGFLPAKTNAKEAVLSENKKRGVTVIFYESTHRLIQTVESIARTFGEDHCFVIAKELTKAYEHFFRGNSAAALEFFTQDPARQKGEFVVILPPSESQYDESEDVKLLKLLIAELPVKQAVKIAAALSPTPKNSLYKLALGLQNNTL